MKSGGAGARRYCSLGANALALAAAFLLAPSGSARAAKGISHFATFEGMRVHYTAYGKGELALVFVHGWNCDESVWENQPAAFAAKTKVLTVDLPGHGASDHPAISYTMDLQARALEAILQDAGVKAAVLVGHSNGTPVVRQFYRRCRERVRGLVIVDGALRPFGDQAMMEKFIAPLRGRDYEQTAARFISNMTAPVQDESEREEIKKMMMGAPQQVAVSEMDSLLDPVLWEHDRIEVPVLMILAKQPAWTAEYEEFVRSLIPNLDYQTWEGVSHFVMLDEPRKFNATLRAFLKKLGWL